MSKARGWPRGWQMPGPRAMQNLQISHPRDSQGGKLPRSAVARGWGAVRGLLGAAGIDCCIMHVVGYFEVISFLILPVFSFLILFNQKKKNRKRAAELYYVIFTPAPGLPTKFGEAERANLISRFWRDSISQGFIFAISTGKYEQRILNFAIQVFSMSL